MKQNSYSPSGQQGLRPQEKEKWKKFLPSLSAPILWYLLSNKINFLFFLRPYDFFPALNWIFLVNCIAFTIQFKPLILHWIQCVPLLSLLKTGWKPPSIFFVCYEKESPSLFLFWVRMKSSRGKKTRFWILFGKKGRSLRESDPTVPMMHDYQEDRKFLTLPAKF